MLFAVATAKSDWEKGGSSSTGEASEIRVRLTTRDCLVWLRMTADLFDAATLESGGSGFAAGCYR